MENKTVDVTHSGLSSGKGICHTYQKKTGNSRTRIHRIIVMNTEESMWNKEWEKLSDVMEIHHLAKSEFDHGGTRAQAAELSDADVMIFMTQDAMPADRELLAELLKALEAGRKYCSLCKTASNAECSFLWSQYTRAFNYPDRSIVKTKKDMDQYGIKTFFCSNVCAAYKKDIYQKQGGFVRRTIFNEDMIYAGGLIQAGYGIAYAAEAK